METKEILNETVTAPQKEKVLNTKPKDNEEFYYDNGKKKVNTKYLYLRNKKPVKGIFRFHECPGAWMELDFRVVKEDGVPKHYKFVDGEVTEIPLGLAIHLNKNCFYPQYSYIQGESTKDIMKATKKVRRVSFQSLEFIDLEELKPENLITVEYASGS